MNDAPRFFHFAQRVHREYAVAAATPAQWEPDEYSKEGRLYSIVGDWRPTPELALAAAEGHDMGAARVFMAERTTVLAEIPTNDKAGYG